MAFVLDCSVALAWVLPDEDNDAADLLADRLERESVYVPSIWPLEVSNALLGAQRRGRITESELIRLAGEMAALPVEVAPDTGAAAFGDVLQLARKLGLTTYDAAYLELARRRSVALATLDIPLRQACVTLTIAVLP
jgi:predicted nucleic acid-binding protein